MYKFNFGCCRYSVTACHLSSRRGKKGSHRGELSAQPTEGWLCMATDDRPYGVWLCRATNDRPYGVWLCGATDDRPYGVWLCRATDDRPYGVWLMNSHHSVTACHLSSRRGKKGSHRGERSAQTTEGWFRTLQNTFLF